MKKFIKELEEMMNEDKYITNIVTILVLTTIMGFIMSIWLKSLGKNGKRLAKLINIWYNYFQGVDF